MAARWTALSIGRRASRRRAQAARDAARALTEAADPRLGLCHAVQHAARADEVFFVEPVEGGGRRITAHAGVEPMPDDQRSIEGPSLTSVTFSTGESLLVADARSDPRASRAMVQRRGTVTVLTQPVRGSGGILAVLVLGWRREVSVADETRALVELIAGAAGLAIERGRLLVHAQRAARTDPLTGLANRRVWDRAVPREFARATRLGVPLAIALVDLDHFKAYNDTHGHQAGDDLLRESATAWAAELRTTDLLARYGGEEFAVLLPNTTLKEAREVVDRLRARTPSGVTASAGIAAWDGNESTEDLLLRVDRAMYVAKGQGRDRSVTDEREGRTIPQAERRKRAVGPGAPRPDEPRPQ